MANKVRQSLTQRPLSLSSTIRSRNGFYTKPRGTLKVVINPGNTLISCKEVKDFEFSIQEGHDYAIKTTSLKVLDKEVSIIISNFTSFSESNKASVTPECQCLKEWKKITSDNWTLETVKGQKLKYTM